jgi:hypothetical protein
MRPVCYAERLANEHRSSTKRRRSWNRHKRSITSPVLKDNIRQNSVAKYFLGAGLEIWPVRRFFFRLFRDNAGDDAITLPELDGIASAKPALQPLGIAKLA